MVDDAWSEGRLVLAEALGRKVSQAALARIQPDEAELRTLLIVYFQMLGEVRHVKETGRLRTLAEARGPWEVFQKTHQELQTRPQLKTSLAQAKERLGPFGELVAVPSAPLVHELAPSLPWGQVEALVTDLQRDGYLASARRDVYGSNMGRVVVDLLEST